MRGLLVKGIDVNQALKRIVGGEGEANTKGKACDRKRRNGKEEAKSAAFQLKRHRKQVQKKGLITGAGRKKGNEHCTGVESGQNHFASSNRKTCKRRRIGGWSMNRGGEKKASPPERRHDERSESPFRALRGGSSTNFPNKMSPAPRKGGGRPVEALLKVKCPKHAVDRFLPQVVFRRNRPTNRRSS